MKKSFLIINLLVGTCAFAQPKNESPETQKCVMDFALNASLPTSFPGIGEGSDPAGDRVYKNIMDKDTNIHHALSSFCVKNGNSTDAPTIPETPEISKCVQGFALEAALPIEFDSIDDPNDIIGTEVYNRIMDRTTLTHRALAVFCSVK